MNHTNLNELAQIVHKANIKWWQDPATGNPIQRNPRELLALVISEVSECLEGERKNLMDDKLPHRKMAEVEMADAYIRLLDFSAGFDHVIYAPLFESLERASSVPQNKGQALFEIMVCVTRIAESGPSWITTALVFIRQYCLKHGYDLEGAMEEKMKFNATREDHTHEARLIAGGKQF